MSHIPRKSRSVEGKEPKDCRAAGGVDGWVGVLQIKDERNKSKNIKEQIRSNCLKTYVMSVSVEVDAHCHFMIHESRTRSRRRRPRIKAQPRRHSERSGPPINTDHT